MAKSDGMAKSGEGVALSQALGKFVNDITDGYFRPLAKPLARIYRFGYVVAGVLTVSVPALFILPGESSSEVSGIVALSSIVWPLIVIIAACVFFGVIISLPELRHGPVRLYLAGVLLPAFIIYIVRFAWLGS